VRDLEDRSYRLAALAVLFGYRVAYPEAEPYGVDPEDSLMFATVELATRLQSLQASWLPHLQFLLAPLLRFLRI
jgi:hypothetical protein